MKRLAAALLAASALASCVGSGQPRAVSRAEIESLLRSHGVEPTRVIVPYRISAEMKRWLGEHVPRALPDDEDRILYLSRSLFQGDDFKIEYVRGYTGTAMEVFETQQANCLAFTLLFIGMARELGVTAYFLEVRDSESYRKEGDLIVVSDHVAVGYGPTHDLRIIDFGAREDAPYRRITLMDDYRAIAMFYSNRGAEELRSERYDEALDWLRAAVAIDPDYAGSWVNLGVALRRSGDLASAEMAYRRALEVDLHSTSALQNLAALLHYRDRGEEALDLLALADRASNRNPFTYITLGDLNMRHGRIEEAGRFYRKALRRQGENAESMAAMGLWTLEQGDKKRARGWLRRAEDVDPESARVTLLRGRLGA